MTITTSPVPSEPNRVYVGFPYGAELLARVKAIPGAKWNPTQRAWSVSKRYQKQIDELSPPKKEPTTNEFMKLFASRMSESKAAYSLFDVTAVYGYNNCHVSIASAVPLPSVDAAFPFEKRSRRGYDLDIRKPAEIELALSALRAIGPAEKEAAEKVAAEKRAEADRLLAEQAEIRRQKRQREAEEDRLRREARARNQAEDAAAGRGRMGVLVRSAPAIGTVMRHGGDVVRINGHGKQFYLGEDDASMGWGPGCEGERACYAYYERASADEAAALEAGENNAAEDRRIADTRRQAIATVAASPDMPDPGAVPDGEVIWEDNSNRATGYRTWIVQSLDGWLWHLTYDGSDGATWGMRNCGENTVGRRVSAADDLVAAIKGNA
ncbi:hypothetical protein VQ042_15775 [Aurantimonas sp. A2-1-M11]|uniref:hypothetical protein n=1 Tax=Aurantimonas sp. A2-1-M11 TaxID=3113712 RepID=UPI002F92B5B7